MHMGGPPPFKMPSPTPSTPRTRIPKEEYTGALPESEDTCIDMAKELMAAIDDYSILGKAS